MPDLAALDHQLNEGSLSCRAIIESPRGAGTKFDYDRPTGLFKLKKILPEGMVFPLDFGFVPATLAEDGDPLDIMVMSDLALFAGALVDVRLIGVIEARQTEQGRTARNDRLLAVAAVSRRYAQFRAPGDLPPEMLHQLVHFWVDKDALEGKLFEPLGVGDATRAITRLRAAAAAFVKAEP